MDSVKVQNWKRSITSYPEVVVKPETVGEIAEILQDPQQYPAPVRAIGSNHSTTRCGTADGGTVVDMTGMDRIVEIGRPRGQGDHHTVTAEAGALYIDVAEHLQRHGLQFYVNVELGNLSIGSAACGGTKDASMPGEFGQVASYAAGMKLVLPSGERLEVTEDDPELLRLLRSSYGLAGIVYEATFKVKPLKAMAVDHVTYDIDDFARRLPELIERGESMMFYLLPFHDKIVVEYRRYTDEEPGENDWLWRFRNLMWKRVAPGYGNLLTRVVPVKSIRYGLIDLFSHILQEGIDRFVLDRDTVATDQIIRYPGRAGFSAYTFSIWAFPEEEYPRIVREYVDLVQDHYRKSGYRCNMINVAYRINRDTSSLFSYSSDGNVITLDPVSTGDPGWYGLLEAYNEFCSRNGGVPLFNQTWGIKPDQARRAFGEKLDRFEAFRKTYDPEDRLLNEYFDRMLHAGA
jgi:FAD/FMN-containing dehydrogenase